MRGIVKIGAAAIVAGLLASPVARAAKPTKGASATGIEGVGGMARAGTRHLVAVGCDGRFLDQTARIRVVDVRTGALAWEASPTSRRGCMRNALATAEDVYVSGDIDDDDGDNGCNLLVQRYRLRDGALVWQQDLEAPNPRQDVINAVNQFDDLQIVGQKLMVWAATSGGATPTIVLRLDRATGELLPAAP